MDSRTLNVLEFDKIIVSLSHLAKSEPGRELCLLLKPAATLELVEKGQTETTDAVSQILRHKLMPLDGVYKIKGSVRRAAAGSALTLPELLYIGSTLNVTHQLELLHKREQTVGVLTELIGELESLPELRRLLEQSIASAEDLNDRASEQLSAIRRRIHREKDKVKESLERIVRQQSQALQEQLITMRGERYVVPVKAEQRRAVPGIVHDTSASGATLFVEPFPVVEANNRILELFGEEQTEIARIIAWLSSQVAAAAEYLDKNSDLLARLDLIQAKGRLAIAQEAIRPVINDEKRIRLVKARHPLIPKERVVPIDLELGYDFRTLVITGPNTGGKTVSLKTCGLLTLMALSGLNIPAAAGSEIALLDKVFADIGDEQSIEQDLSTFSSHLKNLVHILDDVDSRSLVLTDELGSGTDPTEGAALAIAILEYLREKKALAVATTHYRELKMYALQTDGVENACCEFDPETLQPTFRLLIGVPGVSNAFAISKRLGLQQSVIDKARQLLSGQDTKLEDLMRSLEKRRREAQEDRDQAQQLRKEAARLHTELKTKRDKLSASQRDILVKTKAEVTERYKEALAELDVYRQLLQEEMNQANLAEKNRLLEQMRLEIRSGLERSQKDLESHSPDDLDVTPDNIVIGQTYTAPAYGISGKLVAGPDNQGYYQLQSESFTVSVARNALRLPGAAKGKDKPRYRHSRRLPLTSQRAATIQSEIHLLGQTAQEARQNLDKYLDDAVLGGLQDIRIVHGKGTGVLRQTVHDLLKQDARVKSFRLGTFGEGDSGVTIVHLA